MQSGLDITTVIGAFAGMLVGFYGIARIMLTQAAKDREADRIERQQLAGAIKMMATSSKKVADAAVRSANEAEQRNGHLAELVLQGNQLMDKNLDANKAIKETLEKIALTLKLDTKDAATAVAQVKTDLEKK